MTNIIISLLIVFCKVPLINLLGDKGIGYYSIALMICLFLMVCIEYNLLKVISKAIIKQSNSATIRLIVCALLAGAVSGSVLYLGADIIANRLMTAAFSAYAIRALAPCLLFVSILGVLHVIFTGIRTEKISKSIYYIEKLARAVLSVIGIYIFTGIANDIAKSKGNTLYEPAYLSMGASIGFSCGVFIACLVAIVIFIRNRKKLLKKSIKDEITKTMFPHMLILMVFHLSTLIDHSIFNRIMSVQGHKENSYIILLGMLSGKYDFFISIPLVIVIWHISTKIPNLIHSVKEENKRKIYNKIGKNFRCTMLYIIPCTIFYVFYAEPLLNLLFAGINEMPSVLLRTGAVSIIFYSLTIVSNMALGIINEWGSVVKNMVISLTIQIISLLIMMIIFQWGIVAVVLSRIIFALSVFVLNEHTLRERTGYVQEHKRTFILPLYASLIMGVVTWVIYLILNIFIVDKLAVLIVLLLSIPTYLLSLVFLGGITQREMYRLPGGKLLAPLCRKLHLIH